VQAGNYPVNSSNEMFQKGDQRGMRKREELYDLFKQPTAAFRGKPFWSWNGTLDKAELLRQIHVLHDMGFGGVFMHSRTGLVTEYMGDEWFDLINACAEEAEKLGMEAWLYDEDRWPSGTAGGMVTQEPRYRLKFIYLQIVPVEQFQWEDDILAAFQCNLEELSYWDLEPLQQGQVIHAEAGQSILVFTIVEQQKESFYNGYTYLDTLNREAVDKFIELTHEKYKSKSGKHFGKAIKGIFTDEPHRGSLMDGFSMNNNNKEWHSPWTYTLFDRFKEAYGYDLLAKLPELFLLPKGQAFSQVKWHYVDLLQEMFQDNFAKPIQAWCEANDLILTGHILHEDSLSAQTAMVGSVMRYYEHMGYPGVDVLTEGNVNYWIVRQLASSARQLGKKWLLSELYGCTGWQMPLEAHKAVGDWQALFGINLRCHHLSWYTMAGEAKRDYPASISHQSAWWKDYDYVESYFSRLGVVLFQGKPVCDLLVINPVESLWGQIYPGWSKGLAAESPDVKQLEQIYRDTFHWLTGDQIDFDYGDEEMLSRMGSVESDQEGVAGLQVGQAVYRAVLISGLTTMRASTLRLLEKFRQAGGTVIFAGEAPQYIDALASDAALQLASRTMQIPLLKTELLAACHQWLPRKLSLLSLDTGEIPNDIYAQLRSDDNATYIVLMNMDRQNWQRNVEVSIQGSGSLEELFCTTGERGHVAASISADRLAFTIDFPPSGEHVYVLHDERIAAVEELTPVIRLETIAELELPGPFAYRLSEPNVCVLDWARFRVNEGEWQAAQEILQVDRIVRSQLNLPLRHGTMIQPWYTEKFNPLALEGKVRLELGFEFNVQELPSTPIFLVIERPDHYAIEINGYGVEASGNPEWWVDRTFVQIRLPSHYWVTGTNTIVLKTLFHQGVDLEALYLLGEFGVQLNQQTRTIIKQPERLHIGSITEQGFPFYGSKITYQMNADIVNAAVQQLDSLDFTGHIETFLAIPDFEAACIKVMTADGEQRMIAWQPYEVAISDIVKQGETASLELEVILTRRNTFGPLHQLPLHTPAYDPVNWVTTGEHFSDDYVLLPSGILSTPKLIRKKQR
jgi:hypothetical protein